MGLALYGEPKYAKLILDHLIDLKPDGSFRLDSLPFSAATTAIPLGLYELPRRSGDAHLYRNHLDQARLQLTRAPRKLPQMRLNPAVTDLSAFRYEDFSLEGYEPHPHIKAKVAV